MVNSPLRAPTKMENPEMKTTRCEAPASAGKSSLNPDTLNQLLGQMVNDLGAAVNGAISTLIMAKAFPKSEFYGFDLHPASIETANSRAKEQGVTNIHFSVASAKSRLTKSGLDLRSWRRTPALRRRLMSSNTTS